MAIAEYEVRAAGGLVVRPARGGGIELALVHRPDRHDWTFPKGKLDAGETDEQGALREVLEETGMRCKLEDYLGSVEYRDRRGRRKLVRYWLMSPAPGEPSKFVPGDEVDEVRWLTPSDAIDMLTYKRDRKLLESLRDALTPA